MAENTVVNISPVAGDAANDTRASQTRIATATHRGRFLIGFFPQPEIRAFLEASGVPLGQVDQVALDADHAVARSHAAQLGARVDSTITPFGPHPHLDALRAEPTFAEHAVNAVSVDIGWVDLAAVVACQPRVDMDYVDQLRRAAPAVGDTDGLVQFCLPLQGSVPTAPVVPKLNPVSNTFSWLSDNPDFRVCGPVQGSAPGTGRSLIGFSIGPGLHQMSVVSFAGKHMLNNGYHHAVALALAGHTRIPVIVTTVASPDASPMARPGMFSPPIVFGPAPPRIADFLGPAAIDLPCNRIRLLFTVHAEVYPVPA
jgi:hypothetical protein